MRAFLSIYTCFHKVQPHVYGYTYISVFTQIDWRKDTDTLTNIRLHVCEYV